MLVLIHGDNHLKSRPHLNQLIDQAKINHQEIVRFDGKNFEFAQLIQSLESFSLFGFKRLLVIENLFSSPKSTLKTQTIVYLGKSLSHSTSPDLILWEDRLLTSAQLKSINPSAVYTYKLPKNLFSWLNALRPGNSSQNLSQLHLVLQQVAPELILFMLARHIRFLIQAKFRVLTLPAWQNQQFIRQAQKFSSSQLLNLHHQLITFEYQHKTGVSLMDQSQYLDIFMTKI